MSDSFATPWTIVCHAPLSMRFPKQKYSSELPFPSPGDLPNPEIEPASPVLQEDSVLLSHCTKYIQDLYDKNNNTLNFKNQRYK